MKPLNQWFDEYSVSHQNPKNKAIHFICVPAIFFSIVGILMSIPSTFLTSLFQLNQPLIENWAFVALIFVIIFYLRLSTLMAIRMTLFSLLCLIANFYICLLYTSDAADERSSVDLGGRRIIKKKNYNISISASRL